MMGELIGEEHGKRAVRRVLEVSPALRVEVSFEADGQILGLDEHSEVTYWATARPDGTLYGEGKGVVATRTGELATWTGAGTGKFGEGGAVSYRGAVHYYSSSPTLSRLNSMAVIFEFEVDGNGETHSKLWEWK